MKGHIFQSEFSYNINNILPTWRIIPLVNPEHFVCSKIGLQNWLPKPHSMIRPGSVQNNLSVFSPKCMQVKLLNYSQLQSKKSVTVSWPKSRMENTSYSGQSPRTGKIFWSILFQPYKRRNWFIWCFSRYQMKHFFDFFIFLKTDFF